MMEGKRSTGKQQEKMTDGLVNWLGAGKVVEILKATRDRGFEIYDIVYFILNFCPRRVVNISAQFYMNVREKMSSVFELLP